MDSVIFHHGIKGQKWGIRRFQNPDGTWTAAGKKRYGESENRLGAGKEKISNNTNKKVIIGVSTGAAIVAGTVLTAYFIKKYGSKDISNIAGKAVAGKEIVQDVLKVSSVSTTPISQIQTTIVEPKQSLEKTFLGASSITVPRVSVGKPSLGFSQPYNYESLMKQNDDLLKKMLAELV